MNKRMILLASVVTLLALLLAACGGAPTPTLAPAPTKAPNAQPATSRSGGGGFETKSNEGGSVTVGVTPTTLEAGKPIAFDIAMNTHSVDLGDDMTKITILRDDAGKEFKPTAWDGPDGGGHHREGTLTFAALANKPKFVELVIQGLAGVPERVFKWDLP
ncbi:MAG: hypothetical protein KGJ80_06455 [Chloroflexota bacterium]|nr:hypothetical protein [Chloroflexota bacterium]